MHLFYTPGIEGEIYRLSPEESKHCIKVLRLETGDSVILVDGKGGFYSGIIAIADVKGCQVKIINTTSHYGKRKFRFHLAVAPTKNIERTEWLLEKCTEIGTDEFSLIESVHSERKTVKEERLEKVIIAAMKQSLKAYLPLLHPMTGFQQFITNCAEKQKFIAHCHPGPKKRLDEVYGRGEEAIVLIGPEGDFSEEEVAEAIKYGFIPITLGTSRLRTETAAIVACHSINFLNEQQEI